MIRTALVLLTVSLSLMAEEKWTPLFDGKSTQGWEPRAKVETFKAVDGELHLSSQVNVWVVSELQMGDFEVETEVMILQENKGFNSGLGFRLIGDEGKPKGYQCEIDRGKPAGVYGIGMGGWLFPKGPEQTTAYKKATRTCSSPRPGTISAWKPRDRASAPFSTANLLPRLSTSNHSKVGSVSSTTARAARSSSATCARRAEIKRSCCSQST